MLLLPNLGLPAALSPTLPEGLSLVLPEPSAKTCVDRDQPLPFLDTRLLYSTRPSCWLRCSTLSPMSSTSSASQTPTSTPSHICPPPPTLSASWLGLKAPLSPAGWFLFPSLSGQILLVTIASSSLGSPGSLTQADPPPFSELCLHLYFR